MQPAVDLGQWLANFLSQNGMAGTVLAFMAWFLVTRVWPFLVKEYWPAQRDNRKTELTIQMTMRDLLIEVRAAVQQNALSIASSIAASDSAHQRLIDTMTRNDEAQRANYRAMLETIAALHVRLSSISVPLASTEKIEARITQMNDASNSAALTRAIEQKA